jgi:hypothetical protein
MELSSVDLLGKCPQDVNMFRAVGTARHSPAERVPMVGVEIDDATGCGFHGDTYFHYC